jgi:hypothetical protein
MLALLHRGVLYCLSQCNRQMMSQCCIGLPDIESAEALPGDLIDDGPKPTTSEQSRGTAKHQSSAPAWRLNLAALSSGCFSQGASVTIQVTCVQHTFVHL